MRAISDKILDNFQAINQQSASKNKTNQQESEQLIENLQSLNEKLIATQSEYNLLENNLQHTKQKKQTLEYGNEQLEQKIANYKEKYHILRHSQAQLIDQLQLLLCNIQKYLKLIKSEIKKKFGYLPQSLLHAEEWTPIIDLLHQMEQQYCQYSLPFHLEPLN